MEEKLFKTLIGKYLNGTASEEEIKLLEEYYIRLESRGKTILNAEQREWLQDDLWKAIESKKNTPPAPARRSFKATRFRSYALITIAACLVIFAGLHLGQKSHPAPPAKISQAKPEIIRPGGNRALLTLADGSKIILDEAGNGLIADQSGITINKTEDGQLVYTIKSSDYTGRNNELIFNTIETPKGGQYRINLPDGSKVWLNAASSLKFPARFAGNERKVELNGEAYFEVQPDKTRPFKIKSQTQTIEVLGTHFNVNAYINEPSINTTLLEGSVIVSDASSHNVRVLKPGQESRNSGNGTLTVGAANTEEAVSWTKGDFQFNDTELILIMRQLERWYNVDIDYTRIPKTRYNAHIPRSLDLEKVLEVLEVTGRIKFQIQGKTIKILEKRGHTTPTQMTNN